MKMEYYLDVVGYAGLIFECDNFKRNYEIEYRIADDLTELLEGFISFMHPKKDSRLGYDYYVRCTERQHRRNDDSSFEWIIQMGCYYAKFYFTLIEGTDDVSLAITEFDGEEEKEVFAKVLNLNEIIDNILDSCRAILDKYGILGYYLNYWMEFPVSQYLTANKYRHDNIKQDNIDVLLNGKNVEFIRTNINDEMKLFRK
jgi:hypothetical protein